MGKLVRFKRIHLNPHLLMERYGIAKKIRSCGYKNGHFCVRFEDGEEPTQGEIQAILAILRRGNWEEYEVVEQ